MKRTIYTLLACACFYKAGTLHAPTKVIYVKPPVTVEHSVMRLIGAGGGGTGFQVNFNKRQFVLTNDHVCNLAYSDSQILAVPTYGRVRFLTILKRSQTTDLCLLTALPDLPGITLGSGDAIYMQQLAVVGHPHLDKITWAKGRAGHMETFPLLEYVADTRDKIAACVGPKHHLEPGYIGLPPNCMMKVESQGTSAPAAPGSSGSPVLDENRHLIGVVFAVSDAGTPSYMIPFHAVKAFLDETRK